HLVAGPAGLTSACSAAESLPASLRDMREPGSSRSNTRTGRNRRCIGTGGQASRHHNLLPSFLDRRPFAPPLSKSMIEYGHGDQMPAFLLRSSHSLPEFIEGRRHFMSNLGLSPTSRVNHCNGAGRARGHSWPKAGLLSRLALAACGAQSGRLPATVIYESAPPSRARERSSHEVVSVGPTRLLAAACRPSVHVRVVRPVNRLPRRDRRSRIALGIRRRRPRRDR